jgi:outer membrane biosynthesis protein TonB
MRPVKLASAAVAALLLAACSREPAAPAPAAPPATPPPAPAAAPGAPARTPAPPRAARPEAPAPELTLASFKSFTKKRSAEVRRCYEAALANDQNLRGKVTLAFAIQPSGSLSEVRVARSTFRTRDVPACIVTVVRGWKTPFRPSEAVEVEYPLDLRPR